MEITEIRIKLMDEIGERLRAFCSITFDSAFVIRDLKIIEGTHGPFVAMPSRKLTARCPQCRSKNHLRALYCNQCGLRLKNDRAVRDEDGRTKLYADIAHPINSGCREMIQERLVQAYYEEVERSKLPGYVPSYFDYDCEEVTVGADESFRNTPSRNGDISNANEAGLAPVEASGSERTAPPRGPHRRPQEPADIRLRDADQRAFGAGLVD